jgi:hypothetical protein
MSEFEGGSTGGEVATDSAAAGMGDYFDQVQLIDDDGNALNIETESNADNGTAEFPTENTQATAQQETQAEVQAVAPSMNPVLKAGIYNANGEFDLTKATEFFKRTGSFKYEKPKPLASPSADVAPVVAPKSWLEDFSTYEGNIRQNLLGPLEKLWNSNLAAGVPQDDPVMRNIQAEYAEQSQSVEAHLRQKQAEFEDKHIESVLSGERSRAQAMETAAKSQAVQTMLEQEAGGKDAYMELMFGTADQSGNFVQGPGAEVINYLFDMQMGNKENPTTEDYQNWWRDFSANETNARTVFKIASALHLQNNYENVLSSARNEWEKQSKTRREGTMRSPGGSASPAAMGGGGHGYDASVAKFAGFNQPDIM